MSAAVSFLKLATGHEEVSKGCYDGRILVGVRLKGKIKDLVNYMTSNFEVAFL